MNHQVDSKKAGLVVGALLGGLHLFWSILIVLGWAQPLADFIFWAHMIDMSFVVKAFDATAAVTLVVITSVIGYLLGCISARIWNRLHRA